jgi:uncharacterized protein (TIGR03435 family)
MKTLSALLLLAGTASIHAQTLVAQEAPSPAFEVASVRLTEPNAGFSWRTTDSRVDIVGYPLQAVLREAFRVSDYRLSAPQWLNDVFVDIHATIPRDGMIQQVPEMLRSLLVERFALATHSESRAIDAYVLKVGESGHTMREVEAIDEIDKAFAPQVNAAGQARPDNVVATPEGRVRTMAIPGGSRRITSRTMYERTLTGSATALYNAIRMTMSELVEILEFNLDEPVVDGTSLNGVYQFQIELPRDASLFRMRRSLGVPTGEEPSRALTFRAVEGLGLALERQPTPMEVVVVDEISRTPTAN